MLRAIFQLEMLIVYYAEPIILTEENNLWLLTLFVVRRTLNHYSNLTIILALEQQPGTSFDLISAWKRNGETKQKVWINRASVQWKWRVLRPFLFNGFIINTCITKKQLQLLCCVMVISLTLTIRFNRCQRYILSWSSFHTSVKRIQR